MTFDEVTKLAADAAEEAVAIAIRHFQYKYSYDEDDVTGVLVGSLQTRFHLANFGGVTFNASILRHQKGAAAEERRIGADMLFHFSMDTPTQTLSKGVLIQAKKIEPDDYWSNRKRTDLIDQCNKMLEVTPSAFVFNYNKKGIRCGAAARVAGARGIQGLNSLCGWTSRRFFLEFFRCPIGDTRISSAAVSLLPVPFILTFVAEGELSLKEGSSLL